MIESRGIIDEFWGLERGWLDMRIDSRWLDLRHQARYLKRNAFGFTVILTNQNRHFLDPVFGFYGLSKLVLQRIARKIDHVR